MKRLKTVLLLCIIGITVHAQNITLSGYIRDESNGEVLIGATIYVEELELGTVTNTYGFYSITIPQGRFSLQFAYLGYKTKRQNINTNKSQTLSVQLKEASKTLNEVVVEGEAANANIERIAMGVEKLPIKTAQKLPAFMGEVDIIKTIQLLPGIQSGGEASSGLYVRGGGPDENLMLLDEAPVYNASHLLGFFSVFNSNAIKDIKVFKSGIPAQYGGKASSVIDIRQKDGNAKHFGVDGGIGLLSSRLTVEGPVIKDKWTFLAAGRRTYYDILGKAVGINELKDNTLYFYDLNAKSTYQINDKNHLYISGYWGNDKFVIDDLAYIRWGNTTGTIRWNHIFGDKLFMNISGVYSKYDYNLGSPGETEYSFDWKSNIIDYNTKIDLTWFANANNTVKYGISTIKHQFCPGKITPLGESSFFSAIELSHYNALESAVYLSNKHKITTRFSTQYGVRLSHFQQIGEGNVNTYENADDLDDDEITETTIYGKWEKIGDAFIHLEPRLSMKYSLDAKSSVKASYNRMVQNLHLITNTNSPTPLDIWLPTSTYIKPLIVDQVSVGYFRNFNNNMIETSVELYYKNMKNVLDYKEGADLFLNENIETELLHGSGKSMGLELLVKKTKGDLSGWIAYTLAKTTRKIPDINDGEAYPSSYDRTHDLSVVSNYQLNKYWNFGACFVFSTGNPVTYPIAKYTINGNQVYQYGKRNSCRLPNYHRLDLSATYDFKKNDNRKFKQSVSLSLYNVYARRNAYSITAQENESNPNQTEFVQLSIIGNIIPSITYNFKF